MFEDLILKPILGFTMLLGAASEAGKMAALMGKCDACPEIGAYRPDLGHFADDFCYKLYKQYRK